MSRCVSLNSLGRRRPAQGSECPAGPWGGDVQRRANRGEPHLHAQVCRALAHGGQDHVWRAVMGPRQCNTMRVRHPCHPHSVTTALCFGFTRPYESIVSQTDSRVISKIRPFLILPHRSTHSHMTRAQGCYVSKTPCDFGGVYVAPPSCRTYTDGKVSESGLQVSPLDTCPAIDVVRQ